MFGEKAYRKKVRQELRERYQDDLESIRFQVKREFKLRLEGAGDTISELRGKIVGYEKFKDTAQGLFTRELELDQRDAEQDAREDRITLREEHFEGTKEAHKADMEDHHRKINDLQNDVKAYREAAKAEFNDAKSASRKAGYDEGYATGLKAGHAATVNLVSEQRESYTRVLNLSTLASAAGKYIVTGDKKQDDASKVIAEAFAKHLTGTIDKALDGPEKKTNS